MFAMRVSLSLLLPVRQAKAMQHDGVLRMHPVLRLPSHSPPGLFWLHPGTTNSVPLQDTSEPIDSIDFAPQMSEVLRSQNVLGFKRQICQRHM